MKNKVTYSPVVWTIALTVLFLVSYVAVVGTMYPNALRMIEGNAWIDNWILQFFRWPYIGALLMALPMAIASWILAFILKIIRLKKLMPLSIIVALYGAYAYPPTFSAAQVDYRLFCEDLDTDEDILKCTYLFEKKDYDGLRRHVVDKGFQMSSIGARFLMLIESAQGTLLKNLFHYPVHSTEDFLFRGERSEVPCMFNMLYYDNIGIYDEAFHQAQEYAMLQDDFCFFSVTHMIDYAIREYDWKIAEKLLCVLDQALFYGDFVRDRREQVKAGKKLHPKNEAPLRNDSFVTTYSLQNEMVYMLMDEIGDRDKIEDYAIASMLLRKKVGQLCYVLGSFKKYADVPRDQLPECIQQAIEINSSKGTTLQDAQPGTYANFYYYVPIPEIEIRPGEMEHH